MSDTGTQMNTNKNFEINIDKYKICNVLIRSNQIKAEQFNNLVSDILDSFPKLKTVRLNYDEFLYTNYYPVTDNQISEDNLDQFIAALAQYKIKTQLDIFESKAIANPNIASGTNHSILKQRTNSIDRVQYYLNIHSRAEKFPLDLQIKSTNSNDQQTIFDSIDLEISNCQALHIKILNTNKEKYIDTGDLANPNYVNSKIKALHIALKDNMSCRELVIQKPIGNLPITFNSNFKNSIEKITLWNPLCLMIPVDIFECKNLLELNINLLGCKGHLAPFSKLTKLKKVSLYNCYNLSRSQQNELLGCKNLAQIEDLTITFCPNVAFLNKLLDKCTRLKRLHLDPNTLAMLCYGKNNQHIIPQKMITKLNKLDSFNMVLNKWGPQCDGMNPALACTIQNGIFNYCIINQYFETINSPDNWHLINKYAIPYKVSKFLEAFYCPVNQVATDDNDYDLKIKSISQFYSQNFRNFSLTTTDN